jgi:putative ABC transport system permease protein
MTGGGRRPRRPPDVAAPAPAPAPAAGRRLRGGSLWAKVPLLLVRYPGALLAILGASLVIGLAASSDTMFMSSTGSAALQFSVERAREGFAGLRADAEGPVVPTAIRYREELLHRAVRGIPGLGSLRTIVVSTDQAVVRETGHVHGADRSVRLATSTGFLSQVDIVQGTPGPGWWVSRNVARQMRIGPGAHLDLAVTDDFGVPTGARVGITVTGVYRDLCLTPERPYWIPLTQYIQLSGDTCPPPLLLGDEATYLRAESVLADDGEFHWELPVDTRGLTLPAARRLAAALKRPADQLADPLARLGAAFSGGGLGLPPIVEEAQATNDSLAGSVHALSLAGRLLALLVVAIAGVYTVHSRRIEFRGLASRGMAPLALGAKVGAEALLPALVGAAAGWVGALALVRALGPSGDLDPAAVRAAAVQAGITAVLAVLLLGGVAAGLVGAMRERRAGQGRRLLARLPWELAPLALAGAALYEIWTRGAVRTGTGQAAAPSVDVLVPLFPILFIAGVGGLVVRALRRLLPRLRTAGRGGGAPVFLAARRLSTAPATALLLVAASFLAVGVLGYSGVVVSSISATTDAKARLFVGSDTALTVPTVEDLPRDVLALGTPISRYTQQTTLGASGAPVDVLVVDPATFEAHAFWDSRLAPTPLAQLLGEISAPVDGRLPLLSVGSGVPAGDVLSLAGEDVPVRVMQHIDAFPSLVAGTPMVVTTRDALDALKVSSLNVYTIRQVWVDGDAGPAIRALTRAGSAPTTVLTAEHVAQTPAFLSLSWTFGFLQALGVLAGLVALVGLLLYLQARQASREVSYALARRMGLSRRSHRMSVLLELAGMLLLAFAVGTALATAAALLTYPKLDVLPNIPPAPFLQVPLVLFAAVGLALAAFAWIAAWGVQVRADHANVAEVMRFAG